MPSGGCEPIFGTRDGKDVAGRSSLIACGLVIRDAGTFQGPIVLGLAASACPEIERATQAFWPKLVDPANGTLASPKIRHNSDCAFTSNSARDYM